MTRYPDPWDAARAKIEELEIELREARRDIVELMPTDISKLLTNYYSLKSMDEYWSWRHEAIDHIVSMTKADPQISYHQEDRAWCPLCKGGASGHERGFHLPDGLRRHLIGKGYTRQCPVMSAAFKNAEYGLRKEFIEWEQAEKEQEANRRKTERLFLIDPRKPPELIDEYLFGFRHNVRTADELVAAEQRLREFGFQVEVQGHVVAYKLIYEHRLVLADPRVADCIGFRVFDSENPTKKTKDASFYLLDSWKKDLAGKFRERLIKACKTFRSIRSFSDSR